MTHDVAEAVFEAGTRVAKSNGFLESWDPPIRQAIDASSGDGLFVVFVAKSHVAIGTLEGSQCYCRVVRKATYALYPDPFAIAAALPPKWDRRAFHDDPAWPIATVPRRGVFELQTLLKEKESPLLLGACQALVDGSRIAFDVAETPPDVIADVWKLLPAGIQKRVPFSTNAKPSPMFEVVRCAAGELPATGFLSTEQVLDYPESRYEHELQYAIESGNQPLLDRLFARRTSKEVLALLVFALFLGFGLAFLAKIDGLRWLFGGIAR
jgi:hypothetical protein